MKVVEENIFWKEIQQRNSRSGYREYQVRYPGGIFAQEAQAGLDALLVAEREAEEKRLDEEEARREQEARRQAEAQRQAADAERRRKAEQAEAARKRQEAESAAAQRREADRAEQERQAREAQQPGPTKMDAPPLWRRPIVQVAGIGLPLLLLLIWGIPKWTGGSGNSGIAKQRESGAAVAPPPLPEMVRIAGGTFEMGDVMGDNAFDRELPVHTVTLRSFELAAKELSFAEYDAFCEATGREKPDSEGWGRGDRPVMNVSWYDAVAYCNWLSQQAGFQPVYQIEGNNQFWGIEVSADWSANGYRLPTEAEWEYAAREEGKKVRFGNGRDIADPAQMNFNTRALIIKSYTVRGEYRGRTVPVGSFEPNALGLYNMSGNVSEWCWDWAGDYSEDAQTDPRGPSSGSYRQFRGGEWNAVPVYCRVANWNNRAPRYRSNNLGFRLARSS